MLGFSKFLLPVLIIIGVAGVVILDKKTRQPQNASPVASTGNQKPLINSGVQPAQNVQAEPLPKEATSTNNKRADIKPAPVKPAPPKPKPVVPEKKAEVQAAPPTVPDVPVQDTSSFGFDQAWRDAVVNIFCRDRYGGDISGGSGVMIDSRGVILTNAHVGINFLFTEWPSPSLQQCWIRIGSPARSTYTASLLFIPGGYIRDTLDTLFLPEVTGYAYGKQDYALLFITGTSDPYKDLPKSFPTLTPYTGPIFPVQTPVYITAYPGNYIGSILADRQWYMASSPATIAFLKSVDGDSTNDAMGFWGTIAAQHGSSGGAIIGKGGKFLGMPTFIDEEYGEGPTTADNILYAISVGYVNDELKKETGLSLQEFLDRGDFANVSKTFMAGPAAEYDKMYADSWKKHIPYPIPGVYHK